MDNISRVQTRQISGQYHLIPEEPHDSSPLEKEKEVIPPPPLQQNQKSKCWTYCVIHLFPCSHKSSPKKVGSDSVTPSHSVKVPASSLEAPPLDFTFISEMINQRLLVKEIVDVILSKRGNYPERNIQELEMFEGELADFLSQKEMISVISGFSPHALLRTFLEKSIIGFDIPQILKQELPVVCEGAASLDTFRGDCFCFALCTKFFQSELTEQLSAIRETIKQKSLQLVLAGEQKGISTLLESYLFENFCESILRTIYSIQVPESIRDVLKLQYSLLSNRYSEDLVLNVVGNSLMLRSINAYLRTPYFDIRKDQELVIVEFSKCFQKIANGNKSDCLQYERWVRRKYLIIHQAFLKKAILNP